MRDEEQKGILMETQNVDAAFEKALIQALARAEAQPPVFLIPPEIPMPQAFERSVNQVSRAMDISRSALRLAFNFM
ncbi:MAG: hypothetical protein PHP02_02935 [Eubacteriales bacterium]|nr:hypothetical protein [Eubacteriales bacterium]